MSGCATYYSKNKMRDTAIVRGLIEKRKEYNDWLSNEGYVGCVAVYRVGDMWRDVHILWPDGTLDGPYLAIDVVQRKHYESALERNRVVEVDYQTAQQHNMLAPTAVTIFYDIDVGGIYSLDFETNKYEGCLEQ